MKEATFRVRTSEREQIVLVTKQVDEALRELVGLPGGRVAELPGNDDARASAPRNPATSQPLTGQPGNPATGQPRDGICTIVVPHTTCAITVNENADPDVPRDLVKALRAMVPRVDFRHGEGNSDAHFLSMLIGASLSWPYRDGKLVLGTWQGVYFVELDGPRERKVVVYV